MKIITCKTSGRGSLPYARSLSSNLLTLFSNVLAFKNMLINASTPKSVMLACTMLLSISFGVHAQNPCKQGDIMQSRYQRLPDARIRASQLEEFTRQYIKNRKSARFAQGQEYIIPVVFHIFGTDFISGPVNEQTITNALNQVNEDFHGLNDDYNNIDPLFNSIKETMNVWFRLAQIDPKGNPTSGINFYPVEKGFGNDYGYDDKIQQYAWDNKRYCNVYIMLDMYDDLDYYNSGVSWYPDQSMTDSNTARIVYNGRYLFGNTNKEFSSTLSHEFGHWLNLIHTFDGGCTFPNDQVTDTPPENASVGNCRGTLNCFGNPVNGENYMGYTGASKQCYKMFTQGQIARMEAAIQGAVRSPIWQPANVTSAGVANGQTLGSRIVYFADRFLEEFSNDGSIKNTIKLRLIGKTFATSGNLVQGTHFTVANMPAGLAAQITINDATNATLSFTGKATAHAKINSISNATITFLNAAITGGTSGLLNPTNDDFTFLFNDPYTAYCTGKIQFYAYSHITNVKVGTINYSSQQESVSDLTSRVVTNMTKGSTSNLSITANIPNASPTNTDINRIRVWADWNNNFVYETSELVANQEFSSASVVTTAGNYTLNTTITVPTTAATGKIGMRVVVHFKNGTQGDEACGTVESGEFEDYGLNILGPNPSFAANFYVSKTPVNLAEGVYFSDVSTAATGTTISSWQWTFPGGQPATYNGQTPPPVVFPTPGMYTPSLTVTNSQGQTLTVSKPNAVESRLNYCKPNTRYGSYVHITNVTLNTINNTTLENGISDYYNSITTNLNKGQTYPLSVTAFDPRHSTGGSTSTDNWRIRIWADWNFNGIYESGELVGSQQFVQKDMPANGSLVATFNVTVPASASTAKVGLRVMVHFVYPGRTEGDNPCDEIDSGESEDYGLVISGGGDTQAPTAPTNLAASTITTSSVQLTWSAATDNVAVTGYDVLRNGITIASTTVTNYTSTGLTPATAYSFTVKAKDAAGNSSAASNAVSVTTNSAGDTQAPTAPANLTASSVTQTSAQLSWSASTDNVGVTGYDVYSGASIIGNTTTTSFPVTALTPATTYSFTVKAKDAAGNISSASNAVSVTTANSSATYCAVTNGSPGQYVTKVVFGSISNTSAFTTGGYANYTNLTANVTKGSSVSLQVTLHQLWAGSRAGAWIDWNRDGDFADAGEQILNAAGTTTSAYTVNVTIPATALTGTTRMRVRAEYGLSSISPCGDGWHSEVEDYSVTVAGSAAGPEMISGSDTFGSSSVHVYPNPSRGTFTVQVPQESRKTLIHVYNMQGALIKSIESDHTAFIEVSLQATPGLYKVRVLNNANRSTHSIQIE